jgi:hypothetical protein
LYAGSRFKQTYMKLEEGLLGDKGDLQGG